MSPTHHNNITPAHLTPQANKWNLWFGLGMLCFALLCLGVWFPLDIDGGFVHTSVAGRIAPGDTFFPILLVTLMIPLALAQIFSYWRHRKSGNGEEVGKVTSTNLYFLLRFSAIVLIWLAIMAWTGPLLTQLWNTITGAGISSYRALSSTFPINISGYALGGEWLACNLIILTRGRLRTMDFLAVTAVIALLILIFNGLLNDVLLPPNANL